MTQEISLYDAAGGMQFFEALVDRFYDGVAADPELLAIYPEAQPVRLFDLFWKELEIRGARVYEPEDYERAIELLATPGLPFEHLISRVEPLERLPALLDEMTASPTGVKTLVDCRT